MPLAEADDAAGVIGAEPAPEEAANKYAAEPEPEPELGAKATDMKACRMPHVTTPACLLTQSTCKAHTGPLLTLPQARREGVGDLRRVE